MLTHREVDGDVSGRGRAKGPQKGRGESPLLMSHHTNVRYVGGGGGVESLSGVQLFATPWTAARRVPSPTLSPSAFSLSQRQGLFQCKV